MKRGLITFLTLIATLFLSETAFADRPEEIVNNMFNEVLKRDPSPREYDYYINLVIENGWDNSDLKSVLRKKKSDAIKRESGEYYEESSYDYDLHNTRDYGTSDRRNYSSRDYYEKRRWVEYAFEDEVNRLPTRHEMDFYCEMCLNKRYSQKEIQRQISSDFRGKRSGHRSDDYHYNYDRYANDEEVEFIVEDIFREELGQDVNDDSMRKYRRHMIDDGWSERRVRQSILEKPGVGREELETVVVRAYEDLLGRRPKPRERDTYVDDMMRRRWDERKVREMIKRTREYRVDRPKTLIKQAYEAVLLRSPDGSAYGLTNTIVQNDWDLEDVKNHLRKSGEYRKDTIPKMLKIAYKELLNREPDPYGIKFYTKRAKEGWTFERIKDHIRASDEYAERGTGK